jgi:hypothetical protein
MIDEKFKALCASPDERGCVNWLGRTDRKGRAMYKNAKGGVAAARYLYTQVKGPIPYCLFVLHTCDNNRCVNIDHLYLGTLIENNHDMFKRGRHAFAGTKGLTQEEVNYIQSITCWTYGLVSDLAFKFGVTPGTISHVRHGITWKNTKQPSQAKQ